MCSGFSPTPLRSGSAERDARRERGGRRTSVAFPDHEFYDPYGMASRLCSRMLHVDRKYVGPPSAARIANNVSSAIVTLVALRANDE